MDPDRSTKRRGPLTWLAARTRRFWFVVLVVLPTVYILSSGPTRPLLVRHRLQPLWMGDVGVSWLTPPLVLTVYDYWTPAYAPLVWFQARYYASTCAKMLTAYWELYPIPQDGSQKVQTVRIAVPQPTESEPAVRGGE